jgi:hypothetical protein
VSAGGQVERIELHAGGAERDAGAADGFAQPPVLILRVDDRDLDPGVQRPQHIQFRQVGLAGAGAGEHDGVVVVQRPAIPQHQG